MKTKEPVLAACTISAGSRKAHGSRVSLTFKVEGGLHYIHGNSSPHFTLTYTEHRKGFPNQCCSGGAGHERIAEIYGEKFAGLAKMHLSDIDGVPMHAEANGWYSLAGYLPGNAGARYHAGNAQRHFPKAVIDPARSWDTTDYRNPTPDECLQIFADHLRITLDEAHELARLIEVASTRYDNGEPVYEWGHGRELFHGWIEAHKPVWKLEANACIAKYGLRLFGDQWPLNTEAA